jgi:glycosyltransferase involved in cell wall biosynthesis
MKKDRVSRGRVLFILNDAPFFVSHRLVLAVAARDAGFEVHVAVAHDPAAVATIEAAGLNHHDIPLKRGARRPLGELRLIVRLAGLIRSLRPDLVHTVTMKPALYGGGLARLLRVPAAVNAITGLGYLFLIEGALARLQRAIIKRLYRVALGHPNSRAIFQNPDDLNLFVENGLVDPGNAVIVKGTGVDMEKYRVLPEPKGGLTVMFPARVIGDKGIHEFVAAAKAFQSKGLRARFIIVGRTDPDNPTDVGEPTIRQWEREGLVEWWGFSNDMADTLPKAHIVCMPSYREGLPRVLIEAAACGRAIVTADVPGCREIVKDGENGILIPARDGIATAGAIERLLDDPKLRKRMASRSREIAESEYAMDRFIADTLAVYEVVLPRKPNAAVAESTIA